MANEITDVTRRNIIDYLTASGTNWADRLPEDEFLDRLHDLTDIPSTDYRFQFPGVNCSHFRQTTGWIVSQRKRRKASSETRSRLNRES